MSDYEVETRAFAMTVTGHKTSSMYKRYGIEELDSQRDPLDPVTV